MLFRSLEDDCRKCIRMEVSDVRPLARILDGMGIEYKILTDTRADVYAKVKVTQLATALAAENCELLSMQERSENLESYYVSLIGGQKNG